MFNQKLVQGTTAPQASSQQLGSEAAWRVAQEGRFFKNFFNIFLPVQHNFRAARLSHHRIGLGNRSLRGLPTGPASSQAVRRGSERRLRSETQGRLRMFSYELT
jgi:hypothetical protein